MAANNNVEIPVHFRPIYDAIKFIVRKFRIPDHVLLDAAFTAAKIIDSYLKGSHEKERMDPRTRQRGN
jgi:hypothetical protein